MIKFGRLTYPGENIEKEIKSTKRLGFDYCEVGIEAPTDAITLRKNKSNITKYLKSFSLPPIGHTSWWYDLSSPYEGIRKAWINQARVDIKISSELGIKLLNFHFLVPSTILLKNQESRKNVLENYIKSLNQLSKIAQNNNIALMLENGEEKFEYYKYVLDRVPNMKVHFDVGHAYISGGMSTIKKFISYFGGRIAHIHIHDNHGKYDEHLALRKGKINWKKVVFLLKKSKYDKTITIEVHTSTRDLIKSLEYFKKLLYKSL